MKTVKDIKESFNVNELAKLEIWEDVSLNDIRKISTECELSAIIRNGSTSSARQISYSNTIITYTINNDEVINTLRELYKMTKSSFVKSVIETVGATKKCSEKQLDIITTEMAKFDNLTLNF